MKPVGCSSEPGEIFFSGRQSPDADYVPNGSGRGIVGGMPMNWAMVRMPSIGAL